MGESCSVHAKQTNQVRVLYKIFASFDQFFEKHFDDFNYSTNISLSFTLRACFFKQKQSHSPYRLLGFFRLALPNFFEVRCIERPPEQHASAHGGRDVVVQGRGQSGGRHGRGHEEGPRVRPRGRQVQSLFATSSASACCAGPRVRGFETFARADEACRRLVWARSETASLQLAARG